MTRTPILVVTSFDSVHGPINHDRGLHFNVDVGDVVADIGIPFDLQVWIFEVADIDPTDVVRLQTWSSQLIGTPVEFNWRSSTHSFNKSNRSKSHSVDLFCVDLLE